MPSLPITPKYEPGPEIGISTPMRMTLSCAWAANGNVAASARRPPNDLKRASWNLLPVDAVRPLYRKLSARDKLLSQARGLGGEPDEHQGDRPGKRLHDQNLAADGGGAEDARDHDAREEEERHPAASVAEP